LKVLDADGHAVRPFSDVIPREGVKRKWRMAVLAGREKLPVIPREGDPERGS
jgi:hypothetical protein